MIEIVNVSKYFPGVRALGGVSFEVKTGAVHGLVGENGAGKSTLIKILSGIYLDYEGNIRIDGRQVKFKSVLNAQENGVATIFQELTVIQELSVSENIFLGREPQRIGGIVDFEFMNKRSCEVLDFLGAEISPEDIVEDLSVANQQLVEICKALVLDSKIIIMDEPTSSLTDQEVGCLFSLIEKLKNKGITILYVSHKLDEIFKLCDSITVLRDGRHIDTVPRDKKSPDDIIKMMVGRSMNSMFPARDAKVAGVLLDVMGITKKNEFANVTFNLHKGEIIGLAGLIGAGRTEVAKAIIGASKINSGSISIAGEAPIIFDTPGKALSAGIAYLPEDRKGEGLMIELSVRENIVVSILKKIKKLLLIDRIEESKKVSSLVEQLKIKITDTNQIIETLSGGNQQKVIISRLLLTESEIFIFDEPTRGIDVGAKYEIYKLMNALAEEGKGIIFISSELPEILGVSDRIYCMREGILVKEFNREEADPEKIMFVLTGGDKS